MSSHIKIVKPNGIMDATKSQEFRDNISEFIENGTRIVLVDFEDVTFMDSSGLGALVLAFKSLRAADRKLFICSVNEQVRILLELTGMDKVFEIVSNQDEFHKIIMSTNVTN